VCPLSRTYNPHFFFFFFFFQIDIGSELAARVIHKAQTFSTAKKASREHKDPSLFDEAQSVVFKELVPYWAGFCKQYRPPERDGFKLPRKRLARLTIFLLKVLLHCAIFAAKQVVTKTGVARQVGRELHTVTAPSVYPINMSGIFFFFFFFFFFLTIYCCFILLALSQ